jgi:hypothetical protein
LYTELLNNEVFVKLHEGIHAVHMENHERGRRKEKYLLTQNNRTRIASMIPVLKHLLLIPRYNFMVDTEAFSHKIGFDAYMDRLIDQVIPSVQRNVEYNLESDDIKAIKEDFHECSTEFTKRRIKNSYLLRSKIYPAKVHAILGVMDFTTAAWFASGQGAMKYVGYLFGIKAASHLLRGVMSPIYYKRADNCADTLEILSDKYGGAGNAFYAAIGKSFGDLHREAKKHSD